ncbi:MAG: hypothetical protein K0M45_06270 [Candidatus Paracaedibacteraceae bacterium]|nr:hypothetical protein [Candidatus Paracaedibacteraceae bacterium]
MSKFYKTIKPLFLSIILPFACLASEEAKLELKFVEKGSMRASYQTNSLSRIHEKDIELPNTVFFRVVNDFSHSINLDGLLRHNKISVKKLPGMSYSELSGMWHFPAEHAGVFFKVIANEIQPFQKLIISHTNFMDLQKNFQEHSVDFTVPDNLQITLTRKDKEEQAKLQSDPNLALELALNTGKNWPSHSWVYKVFEFAKKEDHESLATKINTAFAGEKYAWEDTVPFCQEKNTDVIEALKRLSIYNKYIFSFQRISKFFLNNLVFFAENNPNLVELQIYSDSSESFFKQTMNDSHIPYIESIIKNAQNLKCLRLFEHEISDIGLSKIIEAVKSNPSIEEINLYGNKITIEGKRMVEEFQQSRNVKFNLNGNLIK